MKKGNNKGVFCNVCDCTHNIDGCDCELEKIDNAYLLKGVDEFLLTSAYNLIYKYANIDQPHHCLS